MEFPEPVIEVAVEPKTKADQEKMGIALWPPGEEDPSFRVETDEESGQTIISGMGELHLDIIVDRMKREFKVEANVGAPQVAYRETIRARTEVDYTHKKQTGGRGQFGHVWLFEPRSGKGLRVRQPRSSAAWCRRNTSRRSKGHQSGGHAGRRDRRLPGGRRQGHPSTVRTTTSTRTAKWRSRSPVRWAFEGRACRRRNRSAARADDEGRGGDAGRLHGRRDRRPELRAACQIQMEDGPAARSSTPMVPLAKMFGYANDLRSMRQGRASYTMEFANITPKCPAVLLSHHQRNVTRKGL